MDKLPIEISADKLGGRPVFRGTRVPVAYLPQYLSRDYTIEEFAGIYELDESLVREVYDKYLAGEDLESPVRPEPKLRLFLDDTRDPEDVYPDTAQMWDVVRDPDGFRTYLEYAVPKALVISFDHDLGAKETGMDLVKWMARQGIVPRECKVHSANVSGAENMRRFLAQWMKHGKQGEPWDPQQAMQNLADQAQEKNMGY